jgi:Tol biopolymer transport system component
MIFSARSPQTGNDIWTCNVAGDRIPRPLLQTPFDEGSPALSHDNRWLAYVSNESGRNEIYVQSYPPSAHPSRVSLEGGVRPVWSRSARELFFESGHSMMSVKFDDADSPARPQRLFERTTQGAYDVSPDGRFLIIDELPAVQPERPITVVLNWRPGPVH